MIFKMFLGCKCSISIERENLCISKDASCKMEHQFPFNNTTIERMEMHKDPIPYVHPDDLDFIMRLDNFSGCDVTH